jgi:hypothetical protein
MSVFLPSNSGNKNFNDILSATSPMPPNWTNVTNSTARDSDVNKVMSDVRALLNDSHNLSVGQFQYGGAKKKHSSKKAPKKGSRKVSRKASRKGSRHGSKVEMWGGKKHRSSKKAAKVVEVTKSKKGSKASHKGSKKHGGGDDKPKRTMPEAIRKIMEVKKVIKANLGLKDGPALTVVASELLKSNDGDVKKASSKVDGDASKIKKSYEAATKRMADKRAAKKAAKKSGAAESESD